MASQQSLTDLIADRYASALYELSSEAKCIDEILNDLLTIQEYIKHNNDFKLLIKSPLIQSNEKMKIIQKPPNMKNFCFVVIVIRILEN